MDDWGNDDYSLEDNAYGSSDDYNDGDLEGFQIDEGGDTGQELSDAEFMAQVKADHGSAYGVAQEMVRRDEQAAKLGDIEQMGMATMADLQTGYIQQLPTNMLTTVNAALSGQIASSDIGEQLRLEETVAGFEAMTGRDAARIAKDLDPTGVMQPSAVRSIDPTGYAVAGTYVDPRGNVRRSSGMAPPAFEGTITGERPYTPPSGAAAMATKFLGTTTREMVERGAGAREHTNFLSIDGQPSEKEAEYKEQMGSAFSQIGEIVDKHYFTERARKAPGYSGRREQAVNEITKFLLEQDMTASKDRFLPLPNEMKTPGLVVTRPMRGGKNETAAWTGLEFDAQLESYGINPDEFNPSKEENRLHWELARKAGSVSNTFAPIDWDLENPLKTQNYEIGQLKSKVRGLRKTLRRDMLSETDLAWGNTERRSSISLSGTHQEYADDRNLRNEAAIQGMQWDAASTEVEASKMSLDISTNIGKGSDRAGMYGERPLSEVDVYVERAKELSENPDQPMMGPWQTDLERYEASTQFDSPSEQRSAEWHEQRAGKVTGSIAPMLMNMGQGDMRVAHQLAKKRLISQIKNPEARKLAELQSDISNAYTVMGTNYEDKVRDTFLATEGKGMTYRESYFIDGAKKGLPGFGATPDGQLFDESGKSAGLLELKFLGEGGMRDAVKKYTPQVQLQMAISGESQTHFFALDRETNEYKYELIQADKEMQADIIQAGRSALAIEGTVSNGEMLQALEEEMKARPASSSSDSGQSKSYKRKIEKEKDAISYAEKMAAQGDLSGRGKSPLRAVTGAGRPTGQTTGSSMGDEMVRMFEQDEFNKDAARSRKWKESDPAAAAESANKIREDAASEKAAADRAAADAADGLATSFREASSDVGEFGKGAIRVLGELGSAVESATKSVIGEDVAARMAGLGAAESRGIRERLQQANLSTTETASLISAAGSRVQGFAERPESVGRFLETMSTAFAGPGASDELRATALPDPSELMKMDGQQQLSAAMDAVNSVSTPLDKMKIAKAWGFPELAAANDVTGGDIGTARDEAIDGKLKGARETGTGLEKFREFGQEALENLSQVGEEGGMAAGGAKALAGVAGTATVGAAALGVKKMLGGKATQAAATAATKSPGIAKSIAKSAKGVLGKAPKGGVAGVAVAAGSAATRAALDVEDDGGLADSALDVLEFGAYGAAIGSVIPGVGTAIGGGLGLAAGLVNEGIEAWKGGDGSAAMPDQSIRSDGTSKASNVVVENNVSIDMSVDKDGTTTSEVEVNGEEYMDVENRYSA